MKHNDVFTISNVHFQFYSYFHNDKINLKCSQLHQFLLTHYKQLNNELSLIQRNAFNSYKQYKFALTNLWKSLENQSEEKREICEKMFEEIIVILKDDNPLSKIKTDDMKFKQLNTFTISPLNSKDSKETEDEKRKRNHSDIQLFHDNEFDSKRELN